MEYRGLRIDIKAITELLLAAAALLTAYKGLQKRKKVKEEKNAADDNATGD